MPKLPSVSGERVVRALKRAGFVELAKGTLSDILKQCGLTLADFLDLL